MGGGFRHIPFGIFSVGFHQSGAGGFTHLGGHTHGHHAVRDHGVFQHQRPGGHHGIFAHHGAVHHRGVHTDQSAVPHRTAMHHCTVADGYIFADRYPQVWPGVQHGVVLDIAVFANADGAGISAHHRAVPHAAASGQHNIPGQGGVGGHKGCTANIRRFAVYCDNCHNFTSLPGIILPPGTVS